MIRVNLAMPFKPVTFAGRRRILQLAMMFAREKRGNKPLPITLWTRCIMLGYLLFGIRFVFWIEGIDYDRQLS
jgi:hypothetical protein